MTTDAFQAACAPADLDAATKLDRLRAAAIAEAQGGSCCGRRQLLRRAELWALSTLHCDAALPFRTARREARRFRDSLDMALAGPPGAQDKWVG
ncbi:hypothetical protein [Geminicoccus flavidas]|uniref:hypothetical protein n=1 Tax=Geminicoccus flavidas TaxID=2506407 RepID=UPI00135A37CC|nr:hypothetical protein [Geminicoccus flavidas]